MHRHETCLKASTTGLAMNLGLATMLALDFSRRQSCSDDKQGHLYRLFKWEFPKIGDPNIVP